MMGFGIDKKTRGHTDVISHPINSVPVEERFYPLFSLPLAQFVLVCELVEGWSELDQPFGVDGRHFSHVFFRR